MSPSGSRHLFWSLKLFSQWVLEEQPLRKVWRELWSTSFLVTILACRLLHCSYLMSFTLNSPMCLTYMPRLVLVSQEAMLPFPEAPGTAVLITTFRTVSLGLSLQELVSSGLVMLDSGSVPFLCCFNFQCSSCPLDGSSTPTVDIWQALHYLSASSLLFQFITQATVDLYGFYFVFLLSFLIIVIALRS